MSESDEEEALDYDAIWNDGMEEKLEEIERNELITRRREKYNKIKSISEICEFFWFLLRITRLLGKGSEIDDETGERMELLTIRGYYKIRSKLEKARHIGDKNKAITRPESEKFAKIRMESHLLAFGIDNELTKQSFNDIFYSLLDLDIEKYSFDPAAYSWALFTSVCHCDTKDNLPRFKAWNRIYPPSTTQSEMIMIKNNTESGEIRNRIKQAISFTESAEEDEYIGMYKQIINNQPSLETEQRRAERRGGGALSDGEVNVLNSIALSQGHINSNQNNELILQKIVLNDVDVDTDSGSDSDLSDDSGFDEDELLWLEEHGEPEISSDLRELQSLQQQSNEMNKPEKKSYLKLTRAWKSFLAAAQIDIEATEAEERRALKKKGKKRQVKVEEKKKFWVSLKSDYSMGFGEVTRPPRLVDYSTKARVRRESRLNYKNKLISDEQQKMLKKKYQENLAYVVYDEEEEDNPVVTEGDENGDIDNTATMEEVENKDQALTSSEITISQDSIEAKTPSHDTVDSNQELLMSQSTPVICSPIIDSVAETSTPDTNTTDTRDTNDSVIAAGSGSAAVKVLSQSQTHITTDTDTEVQGA